MSYWKYVKTSQTDLFVQWVPWENNPSSLWRQICVSQKVDSDISIKMSGKVLMILKRR